MSEVRRRGAWLVAALWLGIGAQAAADDEPILVAGAPRPPVLDLVELTPPPGALAVAPDGRSAAGTYFESSKPNRSKIRIFATYRDAPLEIDVPALARDLTFSPDGLEFYVIQYRPAKKRLGNAELVRVDVSTGKSRGIMRLPATSSAIDYWPARGSLLVGAVNEIRTIRLAGMRSGPLYRIPGPNLAVEALGGTTTVLVGQDRELLLVNLDDPSGEEGMPVRERVDLDAPIITLASFPDGTGALARQADGRVLRVSLGPLSVEEVGAAIALVAPRKDDTSRMIAMAPLPAPIDEEPSIDPVAGTEESSSTDPGPAAVIAATAAAEAPTLSDGSTSAPEESQSAPPAEDADVEPLTPPTDGEPVVAEIVPIATASAATADPAESVDRTDPPDEPPPGPASTAEPQSSGEIAPSWADDDAPQLWGRLSGAAVGAVQEIILLGPNSILREARRITPEDGGLWRADGLEPGRYQVQLSGGGGRVLVSEPRVTMVEVSGSGSTEAKEFRVLRAIEP